MKKYPIPWWKTNLGRNEIREIEQSILAGHTTQGPVVEKLEEYLAKLLDVPYALLTINGSAALLMASLAFEIKAGDEIIVPNLTFIATAQAPLLLGARIKLVDVECSRPLIDIKQVKKAITRKTKAIIPVHLNGRAAEIESLYRLGEKHNIRVIEDAAQALCSQNSSGYLGTQSDIGVFSLGITKLITTVQGGLVVTRKKELFERLKNIRDGGIAKQVNFMSKYGVAGFNFKFNDILASIGLSQLERAEEKIKALKNIYNFYKQGLSGLNYIKMIDVRTEEGELPLWVEVLCIEREKVISLLRDRNIIVKPFDHALSDLLSTHKGKQYKQSELYSKLGLILPSGPDQSKDDLRYVIDSLKEIENKVPLGRQLKKEMRK
jgi:perosamine synthetase